MVRCSPRSPIQFCARQNFRLCAERNSTILERYTMVQVTELGYMGLGVKQFAEWKEFATQILGMELADEGERDRCYLRTDYWHHRLVLHDNGSDDLEYLGFRVAGAEELAAM